MRCGRKKLKQNNEGSALISVLVITTFITIIATTMLYMAAMNYQQKQTDYQNKQSFYGAEKALDEFKSILVQDVQEAYLEAYNETARNFLWKKADRQGYFQESFMNALEKIWDKRKEDVTAADLASIPEIATMNDEQKRLLAAIRKLMEEKASDAEIVKCFYKVDGYGAYDDSGTKKFALKGIQVKCADKVTGNYTTFLYTDICLEPPGVKWVDSSSNNGTMTTETKIETIPFTDYVYYINWHRADYDERNNYTSDNWITTP